MFLKVKGGKVQSSRQGRFGARSECGHQPNSPARLSSLLSQGAQHHCVTMRAQDGHLDFHTAPEL